MTTLARAKGLQVVTAGRLELIINNNMNGFITKDQLSFITSLSENKELPGYDCGLVNQDGSYTITDNFKASDLIGLLLKQPNRTSETRFFDWHYSKIVRAANSNSPKWAEFKKWIISNHFYRSLKHLENYQGKERLIYNEYAKVAGKREI